jgi:hypothetical protein
MPEYPGSHDGPPNGDSDDDNGTADDEQEARRQLHEFYEKARRTRLAKQEPYVQAGMAAIQGMIRAFDAIVWGEIIARATDYSWDDAPDRRRIDQHHLRTALDRLLKRGDVVQTTSPTRGGRQVGVYHFPLTPSNRRQVEKAAARKRLLEARYLGWASGTDVSRGVIGAAAEDTVHSSLREAAPQIGYRLLDPIHGSVSVVLNQLVPAGSLDNAAVAYLPSLEKPVLLAIEVKSLRPWVYPSTGPLYQLLYKAASLTTLLPNVLVLPVFVCRRAHITTYRMARDLGFHVIDTLGIQWLPRLASIEESAVVEVRQELGYVDLRFQQASDRYLVKQFATVIPSVAGQRTARWQTVGSHFGAIYQALWQRTREVEGRSFFDYPLLELRQSALSRLSLLPQSQRGGGRTGGW